jgi:class 3 adenylate cyclase
MSKSSTLLAELIEERLRPDADADEIDRRIESLFRERWCIVFTDMSGFSRRSARSGIISFLVLIHQLNKIVHPLVKRHGGLILKTIADSHLILFRDAREGLRACLELQDAMHRHNHKVPEPDQIYVGCGIGYGDCLKLGDDDIFGIEVNFAAKLGEDLAGPYDIFVTPAAMKAIGSFKGVTFHKVPGSRLGGTKLPYYEAVMSEPKEDTAMRRAKKSRVRFK